MAVIDLDKEFAEDTEIILRSKKDKAVYTVPLIIYSSVGDILFDNQELLKEIFPVDGGLPKISRDALSLGRKILAAIAHEQYEEIDEAWICKNVSLPHQAIAILKLITPIKDYMVGTGFLGLVLPVEDNQDTTQ